MTSEHVRSAETNGDIQNSTISKILNEHYDEVVQVEVTWGVIDTETRRLLADDHLSEVMATLDAGISDDLVGLKDSRAYQRAQSSYTRQLRKHVTTAIAVAKWEAQVYVWGDDETRTYMDTEHDVLDKAIDPYDVHMLTMQKRLTGLFKAAYGAEKRLLDPFFDLIAQDAEQIETLTEFLTDEETPIDEYNGLLIALARNHYDPSENSVIDPSFAALADAPRLYKESFLIGALLSVQQNREAANSELSTTEQWLRMIGKFTLAQSVALEDFVKFVVRHPFDELPDSAKQELTDAFHEHLAETKQKLLSLIEEFRLPHRFTLASAPQNSEQITTKQKRRGGRRVTQKSSGKETIRPPEEKEEEPKHSINTILLAKQIGERWDATEALAETLNEETGDKVEDWVTASAAAIMEQKLFKAYATKHRNAADVEKMIKTILRSPKGNGSHPMEDQKISLTDPRTPQAKRRHVYEFSPNDGIGIGLSDSPESNRTRIYYCISNNQLILLDIKHKTASEHLRGRFRRA